MGLFRILMLITILFVLIGGSVILTHRTNNRYHEPVLENSNGSSRSVAKSSMQSGGSVSMTRKLFTPSQISIGRGQNVTWHNDDTATHTVVVDQGKGPSSGDIVPGSSFSYMFTGNGSYQYHCTIHPSMRGTIVVK